MLLALCITLMGIQHGIAQNLDESCETFYTNISGVCTLASKCPSARKEYQTNGIPPTICKHSGKKLLVCCKNGTSSLTTPVVNRKPADSRRVSERKCEEYSRIAYQTGDVKCRNTGVESLVGSENANQGEFAHMAAIGWIGVNESYEFPCGGSLISPRFVLTSGQCQIHTMSAKKIHPSIVRLGYQILEPKIRDDANPIDIPIKKFHAHPQFKSRKRYNDIGLIELNIDVNFNADIRPACLWNKPDFPGYTKAIAVVWGGNDTAEEGTTKEHHKVLLSLPDNDYCDALLENNHNRHWNGLIESQLCAGELSGGKHRCQGASGTPLQVASKDNKCVFHIIGFISFGPRCAVPGTPVVYTRVSSFLDWIESIVWPEAK